MALEIKLKKGKTGGGTVQKMYRTEMIFPGTWRGGAARQEEKKIRLSKAGGGQDERVKGSVRNRGSKELVLIWQSQAHIRKVKEKKDKKSGPRDVARPGQLVTGQEGTKKQADFERKRTRGSPKKTSKKRNKG